MFTLLSNLTLSALISASTLANPTTPKSESFGASAYVSVDHKIRVAVVKSADASAEIVLRDAEHQVVFRQSLSRKDEKVSLKLNVDELADGKYELEVKSGEGSFRKQLDLSSQPVQQTARVVAMQ